MNEKLLQFRKHDKEPPHFSSANFLVCYKIVLLSKSWMLSWQGDSALVFYEKTMIYRSRYMFENLLVWEYSIIWKIDENTLLKDEYRKNIFISFWNLSVYSLLRKLSMQPNSHKLSCSQLEVIAVLTGWLRNWVLSSICLFVGITIGIIYLLYTKCYLVC